MTNLQFESEIQRIAMALGAPFHIVWTERASCVLTLQTRRRPAAEAFVAELQAKMPAVFRLDLSIGCIAHTDCREHPELGRACWEETRRR